MKAIFALTLWQNLIFRPKKTPKICQNVLLPSFWNHPSTFFFFFFYKSLLSKWTNIYIREKIIKAPRFRVTKVRSSRSRRRNKAKGATPHASIVRRSPAATWTTWTLYFWKLWNLKIHWIFFFFFFQNNTFHIRNQKIVGYKIPNQQIIMSCNRYWLMSNEDVSFTFEVRYFLKYVTFWSTWRLKKQYKF